MIEAYSTNINVAENTAIPFNSITIEKGCTAIVQSPTTIQCNKAGIYAITVDASAEPTAAGNISIQLSKNGVLQPQAQSEVTGAVDSLSSLHFETLVQVSQSNSCCCTSSPTLIQVINGPAATYSNINICVTKIC